MIRLVKCRRYLHLCLLVEAAFSSALYVQHLIKIRELLRPELRRISEKIIQAYSFRERMLRINFLTWNTVSPSFSRRIAISAISALALTYTFFSLVPFTSVGNTILRKSEASFSCGITFATWNNILANNCFTSLLLLFIV